MIEISLQSISIVVGVLTILGSIFAVFFYFQKPQIQLEKRVFSLEEQQKENVKNIEIINKTHFENNGAMQKEVKELTGAINGLNVNVARLETIINERIPKGSPNLTPPGK